MFSDYVFDKVYGIYEKKIILWDDDHLATSYDFLSVFQDNGFEIVSYTTDLEFRRKYGFYICDKNYKLLILANSSQYVPYDIQKKCHVQNISISELFSGLSGKILAEHTEANLDLIASAYEKNFKPLEDKKDIQYFFEQEVMSKENIQSYLIAMQEKMKKRVLLCKKYSDWFLIAEMKADVDRFAIQCRIDTDTDWVSEDFSKWVLDNFGKLSSEMNKDTPVLVSKVMDYMHEKSDKFIIIVMDGMSEFDWSILSNSFRDIKYNKTSVFGMIPTVTSVSRQCLISNKYPSKLQNQWKQDKEKAEFKQCAEELGFKENQVFYEHGYDHELRTSIRCAAIIINDIDDIVHGQKQSRIGMYNDISVMAESGKLANMVKRYIKQGFDVYISADHGNTHCTGLGKYIGAGVETATKSKRMMVLADYAETSVLKDKYPLVEYPKYYLPKNYTYLICEGQVSYDSKGEDVMSHGGITIDEVIVPFIKVMARDNNG